MDNVNLDYVMHGGFHDLCPRCETKVKNWERNPDEVKKGWICPKCGHHSKNYEPLALELEKKLAERAAMRDGEELLKTIEMLIENGTYDDLKLAEEELRLLKPYMPRLEECLRKNGFVKLHKRVWRKFGLKTEIQQRIEESIEKLKKDLKLDENSAYVVCAGWAMFRITDPFLRDEKGFNNFDAWAVRKRFIEFDWTPEKVSWLNKKLLGYERQMKGLGLDYERLKKFTEKVE